MKKNDETFSDRMAQDLIKAMKGSDMYIYQGCDVWSVNCGGITIRANYLDVPEKEA